MNDSLIIAGYVVLTAALMAGSFALGRWERRTVYTPGPPQRGQQIEPNAPLPPIFDKIEPQTPVPLRAADAAYESVRLVPRYPQSVEDLDKAEQRRLMHQIANGLDVPPWALNDWPPPGTDYWTFASEQAYWLNLLGDPTKKGTD
jgi:hypothetical protein